MNQFNNMSNEQLIARIEDYKADGLASIKNACVCLKELKARGAKHSLHQDRLYHWFNDIADDRLHPGIAALFNGNPKYLDYVVGRNMDTQKAMAAGREFDVVFERKGQIVDGRKSVTRMSLGMFQRMLPLGKPPATLKEQREALEAELASRPVTRTTHGPIVKANATLGILKVGNTSVPFSAIRAALAEIGMTIQEN